MLAQEERSCNGTTADTAAKFRELGISFLPIGYGSKKPSPTHLPGRSWDHLKKRRPTAAEELAWFGDNDSPCGIGAITGLISGGLVIRDFDNETSYAAWEAAHPELAAICPTEKSPRGHHVYVRVPNVEIRTRHIGDGEIRGEEVYAVCAPSVGEGGELYEWLIPLDVGIPVVDLAESGLALRWDGVERHSKPPRRSNVATTVTECGIKEVPLCNSSEPLLCNSSVVGTEERVERAIHATQPTGVGQRRRCLFRLAQKLKGIPELAAVSTLEDIARRWWRHAYPAIGTKEVEITVADFLAAYDCVRYPDDSDPVGEAAERARLGPVLKCMEKCRSDSMKLLAAVCFELSLAQYPQPFYLSCRDAARVTGRDNPVTGHVMAAHQIRELENKYGAIKCVVKPDTKKFKAGRYVFTGAI